VGGEDKEMSGARIFFKVVGDQSMEPVVTLAHVNRFEGHKHACGRTCGNHREEAVACSVKRNSASRRQKPAGICKTELSSTVDAVRWADTEKLALQEPTNARLQCDLAFLRNQ